MNPLFDPLGSIEAEEAVICLAVMHPNIAAETALLSQDMFTDPVCAAIHRVIVARKGNGIDLVTVVSDLNNVNGPSEEAVAVCSQYFYKGHFKEYVDLMKEALSRRSLLALGQSLEEAAQNTGEDISVIRDKALKALRDINDSAEGTSITASAAVLKFANLVDRMANGDHSKIMYTGLPSFDAWLGGFTGSKLIVIGARPGVGKSAFALQIGDLAAKCGKRVLLCSYEMSEEDIVARLVSRRSKIPVSTFDRGVFTPEDYDGMNEAYADIHHIPLNILTVGNRVGDIRKEAMRLSENGGLDAVIVDYLQLMSASSARDGRAQQVAEISRELRLLSMELGVPIFALCQLNRNSESEGRRPAMSDARESGAIEQDANVFILLHDPDKAKIPSKLWGVYDWAEEAKKMLVEIVVDKNRQGRTGTTYAIFDGTSMTFTDITSNV